MWIEKKEWGILIVGILLLLPGILFIFSDHGFVQLSINKLGVSRSMTAIPYKSDNRQVVIKVSGISDHPYKLLIQFYYKDSDISNQFKKTITKTVTIPAGEIHGTFVKRFQAGPQAGEVKVAYIPQSDSATGYLELKAGIF